MLEVWTDGACEPNPGRGGWGWTRSDGVEHCGGEPETTNYRMELFAILHALRALAHDADAVIYSDSQYCVKGLNEWVRSWQRRGWIKAGGPIKNLELWQLLWDEKSQRPRVRFKWVRGHAGNRGNERADELADMGRRGMTPNGQLPAIHPELAEALEPFRRKNLTNLPSAGRDYDRTGAHPNPTRHEPDFLYLSERSTSSRPEVRRH